MPEKDEESLEFYWDDIRVAPLRSRQEPPNLHAGQNDLVIRTSASRLLVCIKPDGSLEYGPEYHPDEAAQVFWEVMARRRRDYEERLLVFAHMEQLLTQVGRQDLECERLRRLANEDDLTTTEKASREQYAELAMRRLEMWVHQVIELGRGLVARPETPIAAPQEDGET